MKQKVLIPNRGIIALDIINSLNSVGLETILMHSPEDSLSLPARLADKNFKFYSSRLGDSYLDMEAIIEEAAALKVDYIHPGYGFLSENPEFSKACRDNNIQFIGPDHQVLAVVRDKIALKEVSRRLGIKALKNSKPIHSPRDATPLEDDFKFPVIVKPIKGAGGKGFRLADYDNEAREHIDDLLKREAYREEGIFVEEFLPFAHHIEIPFFRDIAGNILLLPEIESSVQWRFRKIFQESPSVNVSEELRHLLLEDTRKIIEEINYVGLGYAEFIVQKDAAYFSEINPTFQINTIVPEVHMAANFIKKQFAISTGGLLHQSRRFEIVEPKHHVLLVSLMAEDPFNNFQPSVGTVTDFFHYSTIRNIFKTNLHTGTRITSTYDPYIGKILTFAVKRENAIRDMKKFLDNIVIRGVRTNLNFLKYLLENQDLQRGDTIIDFLNLKCEFSRRKRPEEEAALAAALLAAAFHVENRKKNYKAGLKKMKRPGFLKRLFN